MKAVLFMLSFILLLCEPERSGGVSAHKCLTLQRKLSDIFINWNRPRLRIVLAGIPPYARSHQLHLAGGQGWWQSEYKFRLESPCTSAHVLIGKRTVSFWSFDTHYQTIPMRPHFFAAAVAGEVSQCRLPPSYSRRIGRCLVISAVAAVHLRLRF
jgi:hypothetical protein